MKMFRKTQEKTGLGKQGFTLVELLVAGFLFPVLFLTVYSLLNMANIISNTSNVFALLNQSAIQTLRTVSREIAQTSPSVSANHLNIIQDANNNSVVRFQIPVDWDNDGDAVGIGPTNPVEWGTYDDVGHANANGVQRPEILGRWARYSVINNQVVRDVLDAALNPVAGLNRVIANNVSPAAGSFTVTGPINGVVRITITLRGTDRIGQNGSARVFSDVPFTNDTLLPTTLN